MRFLKTIMSNKGWKTVKKQPKNTKKKIKIVNKVETRQHTGSNNSLNNSQNNSQNNSPNKRHIIEYNDEIVVENNVENIQKKATNGSKPSNLTVENKWIDI